MNQITNPVYERPIPERPWPACLALALLIAAGGLALWEWSMRGLGLEPGDLGDGMSHWAAERRRLDEAQESPVVIVGASRILFATDLDRLERISGRRPIQLALPGTNARPILADLASDEDFAGLVVVGITETSFFRDGAGLFGEVLSYTRDQSPSQWLSHRLYVALSRWFAFIDRNYGLLRLIERTRLREREPVGGPYDDVWKLSVAYDDRQTWLWQRIETDPFLREHARHAWDDFRGDPIPSTMVDTVIASTRSDIGKIRERGGDVVFIRPPSGGPVRANERLRAPRSRVWDRLLEETGAVGIHFEDHPEMMGLDLPEWSHLSRRSAERFTEAYVRVMMDTVPWLASRRVED